MTCYAPITHSVKEYMLEKMKTADGDIKNAVNEKMFEMFPGLKIAVFLNPQMNSEMRFLRI